MRPWGAGRLAPYPTAIRRPHATVAIDPTSRAATSRDRQLVHLGVGLASPGHATASKRPSEQCEDAQSGAPSMCINSVKQCVPSYAGDHRAIGREAVMSSEEDHVHDRRTAPGCRHLGRDRPYRVGRAHRRQQLAATVRQLPLSCRWH
ncbi:putative ATP-grasp-modified RiPP [Streptomyces macrosporus]|uniref:putative ATP-grasp-modified RiPP n=1 Tax=Streptomyces macrosporus TaxID=44032 RepID=UPI0031CDBD9E